MVHKKSENIEKCKNQKIFTFKRMKSENLDVFQKVTQTKESIFDINESIIVYFIDKSINRCSFRSDIYSVLSMHACIFFYIHVLTTVILSCGLIFIVKLKKQNRHCTVKVIHSNKLLRNTAKYFQRKMQTMSRLRAETNANFCFNVLCGYVL